uniref:Large ribosomal subunit protein mL49 n=1 Tax=Mola mola TaxID=94237 RepID=A0A3Q3XHU4_MOLML
MATFIVRQSPMLRRALLGAFSLHSRILGHPDTNVRLRFIRHTGSEEKTLILESTEEYKFVERLIPPSRVPTPRQHTGNTPSGWRPSADSLPLLPYMIRRSRMHNIPVYTDVTHGSRKTTLIRKVEGDIWALDEDVKKYLKEVTGKQLPTQVNEVTMSLRVKGHFDVELKEWLVNKGF